MATGHKPLGASLLQWGSAVVGAVTLTVAGIAGAFSPHKAATVQQAAAVVAAPTADPAVKALPLDLSPDPQSGGSASIPQPISLPHLTQDQIDAGLDFLGCASDVAVLLFPPGAAVKVGLVVAGGVLAAYGTAEMVKNDAGQSVLSVHPDTSTAGDVFVNALSDGAAGLQVQDLVTGAKEVVKADGLGCVSLIWDGAKYLITHQPTPPPTSRRWEDVPGHDDIPSRAIKVDHDEDRSAQVPNDPEPAHAAPVRQEQPSDTSSNSAGTSCGASFSPLDPASFADGPRPEECDNTYSTGHHHSMGHSRGHGGGGHH